MPQILQLLKLTLVVHGIKSSPTGEEWNHLGDNIKSQCEEKSSISSVVILVSIERA